MYDSLFPKRTINDCYVAPKGHSKKEWISYTISKRKKKANKKEKKKMMK